MSDVMDRWVVATKSDDGRTEIEHRDGIPWHDAPVPLRWHRCSPQTRAWFRWLNRVYRCACGAISDDGKHWMERNSRRRR